MAYPALTNTQRVKAFPSNKYSTRCFNRGPWFNSQQPPVTPVSRYPNTIEVRQKSVFHKCYEFKSTAAMSCHAWKATFRQAPLLPLILICFQSSLLQDIP